MPYDPNGLGYGRRYCGSDSRFDVEPVTWGAVKKAALSRAGAVLGAGVIAASSIFYAAAQVAPLYLNERPTMDVRLANDAALSAHVINAALTQRTMAP